MQLSVSRQIHPASKQHTEIFTDGRRVVYLCSTPCLALGSFGVSVSHSVPELLFWRVLQAAGSSAGVSTGIAIIGDIYKLEERGTAMGITFGVRHSIPPHRARGSNAEYILSIGSSDRTSGRPINRRNCHGVRLTDPPS